MCASEIQGLALKNTEMLPLLGWIATILDASRAEALALLKGIDMLDQFSCSFIVVESDSLELIQACNGVIEVWSPYFAILAECFMKASTINRISFHHFQGMQARWLMN
jgi:hypothetical protein